MIRNIMIGLIFLCAAQHNSNAQDAASLLQKVKARLDKVNDYEASGEMKTNVSFMKVPAAQVKVYFKKPGKIKIRNALSCLIGCCNSISTGALHHSTGNLHVLVMT